MLFTSREFLFAFLPICLVGFYLLGRLSAPRLRVAWVVACSAFFYGYWDWRYLFLLGGSLLVNFAVGTALLRFYGETAVRTSLLVSGLVFNLGILGYYKYADFFIRSINTVGGSDLPLLHVLLPLGISFFTFQKIGFLVDCYRRRADPYNVLDFAMFVMFFPQLIAGPIVHHSEIVPQLRQHTKYQLRAHDFAIGLTLLTFGLFKKLVLADTIAFYSNLVFGAADSHSAPVTFVDAWVGSVAYALQLYFDFSGYSDMAIGMARMFGILLPLNFSSPYKAVNIVDFWRRWHITLSRFLRDYLYIPLGGSRRGRVRRYANLLLTMLLGGLWHGAGWNFVIWGGLHGCFLCINHAWHAIRPPPARPSRVSVLSSTILTFLAVVVAWVFFRATTLSGATTVLRAMAGLDGFDLQLNHGTPRAFVLIGIMLSIVWFLPNSQQILNRFVPSLDFKRGRSLPVASDANAPFIRWTPDVRWAAIVGTVLAIVILHLTRESDFIYYQF